MNLFAHLHNEKAERDTQKIENRRVHDSEDYEDDNQMALFYSHVE